MPLRGILVQNIREEKQLEYKKDNEKFDKNYNP